MPRERTAPGPVCDKKYEKAVTVQHFLTIRTVRPKVPGAASSSPLSLDGNTFGLPPSNDPDKKVDVHHCTRKVFLCPLTKSEHQGKPARCGQSCHRAQNGTKVKYEDEDFYRVTITERKIIINKDVLTWGFKSSEDSSEDGAENSASTRAENNELDKG